MDKQRVVSWDTTYSCEDVVEIAEMTTNDLKPLHKLSW